MIEREASRGTTSTRPPTMSPVELHNYVNLRVTVVPKQITEKQENDKNTN